MLHSVLMKPTLNCNIDCRYCYYGEIRTPEKMSLQTLENAMYQLRDRSIHFIWHGGEPLLMGIEFYRAAMALQKKYNIVASNNFQSNVTLINEDWIGFLKESKSTISTSLDGCKYVHDRGRSNSFDRVVSSIKLLQSHGLRIGAVSLVSSYSLPYLFENWETWHELGINVRVNPVHCCHGNSKAENVEIKAYEFALRFYYDLYLGQNKIRLDPMCEMKNALNINEGRGCVFHRNCAGEYPCIIYDGTVNHCGLFVGTNVGVFGNVNDPDFQGFERERNSRIQELYDLNEKRIEGCRDCEIFNLCRGGCLYQGWKHGGKDPYCEAFKNLYEHIIVRAKQMGG